mgnify:CR=1 FL=1
MFEKIEKFVACACVAVMAVLVFANVIARYVFNHSLAVSDEMSTYLFVLMSFMGAAFAAIAFLQTMVQMYKDYRAEEGK